MENQETRNQNSENQNNSNESENIQQDNETTGSGYSQEERNREDSTNADKEIDPDYYKDKENPKKPASENTDYNRNESLDETEGVAPNR